MSALPPGPTGSRPAQTAAWVFRPGPFLARNQRRYGDTFTITIGREPAWVVISHPEAVRQVFTGDPAVFHAGEANEILRPLLGSNSVLLLDGAPHMAQRKLLLPPFHGNRMARYAEIVREIAEREIAGWDGLVATHDRMQALTLSVIMRTVFGVDREGPLHAALRRALDLTGGPRGIAVMAVMGTAGLERRRIFRGALGKVDRLIGEEIVRRRATPGEDVLSMLVQARHEDGTAMSDAEIRDELMTLLVAGHETTATGLAWAVERLARHPDAWARLRADGEPYADAVVKETLRLRPVLPVVVRRLTQDAEVAGHALPAGVTVAPCIWLLHRREDVYPQATMFRPERFLENKPGTYTWIPFGGGVRRCLGASFAELEMRIVLQVLAARLSLAPDRPAPELVRRRAITLTPARGGRVRVGNRPAAGGVPAT
jgi:cytochrome P450